MSPLSKKATSLLAEQFAEIYQMSQEEYRNVIAALWDDAVDLEEFTARANEHIEGLLKLKKIRVQLRSEREELSQLESRQ